MSEHLFKGLLTGSSWEEGAVRETLEQIESPFPFDGQYRVLALYYRSREHGNDSPGGCGAIRSSDDTVQ